jgi:ribosomal protein L29
MKTNLEKLASTVFLIKMADRAVPFDRWDDPFSGNRFLPNPNYQVPPSGSNRLGPLSFVPENRATPISQSREQIKNRLVRLRFQQALQNTQGSQPTQQGSIRTVRPAPSNAPAAAGTAAPAAAGTAAADAAQAATKAVPSAQAAAAGAAEATGGVASLNRVSIPKSPIGARSGAVPNNATDQIRNRLARLRLELQNTQGSQPTQQGSIRKVRPVPSAKAVAAGAAEATGGVATKATAQSGRLANLLSKLAPVKSLLGGVGRFAGRAMPVAGAGLGAYAAWQNLKGMADQFSQGNLWKGLGQGGAALLNAGAGAASIIPGVGWVPALALAAGGTGLDALSKGASFVKRAGIIDSLEKAKSSAGRKGDEAIDALARSSALRRGDEALNTLSQIEQNKQISPSKLLTTLALLSAAPTAIGAGSGALIGGLTPGDSALAGARRGAYTGAGLTLGGLAGTTLVRSLLPEKLKDSELANLSAVLLPAAAGGLAGNIMARRRNRKEQEYKAMRQALAAAGYRVT